MALREIQESDWDDQVLRQDGTVLVDFFADWCGPCRALAPLLERFADAHADTLHVVKIDTDRNESLAERYSVRTIPTLIAFRGGEEVARAINPQSRTKLEELIA